MASREARRHALWHVQCAIEPCAGNVNNGEYLADWFVERLSTLCAVSLLPPRLRGVLEWYADVRPEFGSDWQALNAMARAARRDVATLRQWLDEALDGVAASILDDWVDVSELAA